jgi:hypothetical protein
MTGDGIDVLIVVDVHATWAADGLAKTRGATLDATARVMHPAQGHIAIAAQFRLGQVPRSHLLTPTDRLVVLPLDHDGTGRAADLIQHLGAAEFTYRHTSPHVRHDECGRTV